MSDTVGEVEEEEEEEGEGLGEIVTEKPRKCD